VTPEYVITIGPLRVQDKHKQPTTAIVRKQGQGGVNAKCKMDSKKKDFKKESLYIPPTKKKEGAVAKEKKKRNETTDPTHINMRAGARETVKPKS